MRIAIIIIFIISLLFLQIGILPNFKIANNYPNLILLTLIALTILTGWKQNLIWIIVVGLFFDFYSLNNVLGISIIILLLTCVLTEFLSRRYLKKESKLSLILIFAISLIFNEVLLNSYWLDIVIKTIYGLILSLPVFYTIKWYVDKIKQI